jgi:hypothetical protein
LRHSGVDYQPGLSSAHALFDLCLATGAHDMNVRRTMVVQIYGNPQFSGVDDCRDIQYNPSG